MPEAIEVSLSGLQLAGRLHEAHQAFLRLVGQERLSEIVEQWRPLFDGARAKHGWSVLEAGMEFLKTWQEHDPFDGAQELQLVAVTVELMSDK